ncbi:hypothetical protein BGW42_004209 [Actinomortierella wolfii]|nr:hypothetical protein BGW42_004209 [Actinomortierella wolfii]
MATPTSPTTPEAVHSAPSNRDSFSLRPTFMEKFKPQVASKFMQQILQDTLVNKTYNAKENMELNRYKYVVNVVLGENLGEGARMDARCHWDQESDGYAQAFFSNNRLARQ